MTIDFHCHTLFSIDSYGTPEELVDIASEKGLKAISITEHNHLGSAERAAERARMRDLLYFPGIEMDAFYGKYSYHFLGLGIDPHSRKLVETAARNHACYEDRFEIYYDALKRLGFPWEKRQIEGFLPERYPGHPSPIVNINPLRRYVLKKGEPENFEEMHLAAWEQVVAKFKPRFCSFVEARDAIHEAGGFIFLAHIGKSCPPEIGEGPDAWMELAGKMVADGLDGLELYHPANFKDEENGSRLVRLAMDSGLMLSGGSDCGHLSKPHRTHLGICEVPEPVAARLIEALSAKMSAEAGRGLGGA